jgi:uncharacterized protein YidB (DUF937 family)
LKETDMGLLDGMLGDVVGSVLGGAQGQAAGGGNAMLDLVMKLMQQQGGLSGLVGMLTKSGLGEQAASWVSTGANLPVSAEQITQVLGSGTIGDLAAKMGMNAQDVSGGLAQYLPEVVNQLTPDGNLPSNDNELLSQGLDMLRGKLFG